MTSSYSRSPLCPQAKAKRLLKAAEKLRAESTQSSQLDNTWRTFEVGAVGVRVQREETVGHRG